MKITEFFHPELHIDRFELDAAKSCCFYGTNDSGITVLLRLLTGAEKAKDSLEFSAHPAVVTFQDQQDLYEEELRNDDTDFMDRVDPGTLVRDFLPDFEQEKELITNFNMGICLDKGFRQLSSGQGRKMLILRELLSGAAPLVIENPYDGLDETSCNELNNCLEAYSRKSQVLLFVNRLCDIPEWIDTVVHVAQRRIRPTSRDTLQTNRRHRAEPASNTEELFFRQANHPASQELISLQNGAGGYGDQLLFERLDISIKKGDHTLITGHNGCGKSTLLAIFTGDHPGCYTNDLRLFGRKRGSGESIWDIKNKMGIVSQALHRDHRSVGTALHVVLSGLFDSIGLYQKPTQIQIKQAEKWLKWIGLEKERNTPFRHMNYANQKLLLIARALVKEPALLILDEPTQGLDDLNREKLLQALERLAAEQLSTIIFVSHRQDEFRPFFKQHIVLDNFSVTQNLVKKAA